MSPRESRLLAFSFVLAALYRRAFSDVSQIVAIACNFGIFELLKRCQFLTLVRISIQILRKEISRRGHCNDRTLLPLSFVLLPLHPRAFSVCATVARIFVFKVFFFYFEGSSFDPTADLHACFSHVEIICSCYFAFRRVYRCAIQSRFLSRDL